MLIFYVVDPSHDNEYGDTRHSGHIPSDYGSVDCVTEFMANIEPTHRNLTLDSRIFHSRAHRKLWALCALRDRPSVHTVKGRTH